MHLCGGLKSPILYTCRYMKLCDNKQEIKLFNFSERRMHGFPCLTNQSSIHEKIQSRFKSGNACYHSVQNILSSTLVYKNLNNKIYIKIILPVVLYGCETWSLTLGEKRRLGGGFENRVLRRISGPKRDEVTGEWKKKLHNEELNGLYCSPNIVRVIKSRRIDKRSM